MLSRSQQRGQHLVHIMLPLAFSERKSRTDLVEAACVKWAQLQQHCLLEMYKSMESLLWHQVCASYLTAALNINSCLKMAASFLQETFPLLSCHIFPFLNSPVTPVSFPLNFSPRISQSHQVLWSILTGHLQKTVTLCLPRSQQFSSGLYHCAMTDINNDFVCSHRC